MSRIVLASNNAKKLVELRRTFEGAGTEAEIVGLSEVSDAPAPEETGRTFVENASSRLVLRPTKPVYLLWLTTPDSRLTLSTGCPVSVRHAGQGLTLMMSATFSCCLIRLLTFRMSDVTVGSYVRWLSSPRTAPRSPRWRRWRGGSSRRPAGKTGLVMIRCLFPMPSR